MIGSGCKRRHDVSDVRAYKTLRNSGVTDTGTDAGGLEKRT